MESTGFAHPSRPLARGCTRTSTEGSPSTRVLVGGGPTKRGRQLGSADLRWLALRFSLFIMLNTRSSYHNLMPAFHMLLAPGGVVDHPFIYAFLTEYG